MRNDYFTPNPGQKQIIPDPLYNPNNAAFINAGTKLTKGITIGKFLGGTGEKTNLNHIQSQSEKADVWVNLKQSNEDGEKLILNLKINSNLDLESLLSELGNLKEFKFDYDLDHLFHHLVFYNGIDSKKAEDIAYNLNPEIDELLSGDPIWENDFNGILQLVQITCLQSKLANE